jgi:histone acetyltransferase (RNA polymerase elongator complex component)
MAPKPLIIPIFIPHQGCPHRCTFCNQSAITTARESVPGPAELTARIETYLAYAAPARAPAQVAFYGGNFLGLGRAALTDLLDSLRPCLKRGQITGIRFSTRPDTITDERLGWIAAYPVDTVEIGVQSMNDKVLRLTRRGHRAADTLRAMGLLKAAGYQTGIQLMLGLPGDSAASALETARAIVDLHPDFVRIYPTLVLAGSPLAADFNAGRYTPLSLTAAVEQAKALVRRFHQHRIPVIRLGLQSAEGLDDPAIVLAGPHHPAFGHLVYAGLYRDAAQRLLAGISPLPESPVLKVNPRHFSRLQGLNKENLNALRGIFSRPGLQAQPDPDQAMDTLACADRSLSVWSMSA